MKGARSKGLEELDRTLNEAARLLEDCQRPIVDLELTPPRNIARIGQALSAIIDIQLDIYELRPDLKPDVLKPELDPPTEDT